MPANRAARRGTGGNVFEAFRAAVYAHGVERLAPLMGLRPGTLYNKADAGDETLTLGSDSDWFVRLVQSGIRLDVLTARVEASSALVTFNGKSFDLPTLATRAVMNHRARLPARRFSVKRRRHASARDGHRRRSLAAGRGRRRPAWARRPPRAASFERCGAERGDRHEIGRAHV